MSNEQEKLDQNIKENWLAKIGVQKPYTVFVCIVAIIILGWFAFSSMPVDLFPDMNLPYAIVVVSPNQTVLKAAVADNILQMADEQAQASPAYEASQLADVKNILNNTALTTEQQFGLLYQAALGSEETPANLVAAQYVQMMQPGQQEQTIQAAMAMALPAPKLNKLTNDVLSALSTVNGISKTQSTTMLSVGVALIMMEYQSNATIDTADLVVALDRLGLTDDANYGMKFEHNILKLDPSLLPIMQITVANTNHDNDEWFDKNVVSKLKSTAGVGTVTTNIEAIADQTDANSQGSNINLNRDEAWQNVDGQLVATRSIAVQKSSNAVTIEVAVNVIKTLEQIKSDHPDFTYNITSSQAEYINQSIGSVGENLIIGGILALIILFLFLRSLKMTLAIGISIPLAVVGTFVAMYFMGINLNIISMSGLALAVGMLVDNSVVVLENIFRLRSKGLSIKDAAVKGASQIMMAMLASALTTICVFFPMFFLKGMIMEIFTDLIWVVILSLACSFIVAVMFLPSIVTTFKIEAKPAKAAPAKPSWWQRFTTGAKNVFDKVLHFAINQKWWTVAIAVILFVGSALLLLVNGFILLPSDDAGTFTVTAQLSAVGSAKTDKKADLAEPMYQKIAAVLGKDLDQCVVQYVSGTDTMSMLSGASESIQVEIKLQDRRHLTTTKAADKVYQALQDFATENYSEVEVSASSLTSTLVASDVSVTIASGNGEINAALAELDAFSTALAAKFDTQAMADLKIKAIEWEQNAGTKIHKINNKNVTTFTIKAYADADTNQIQSKLDGYVQELLASDTFKNQDLSTVENGLAKQLKETYSSMGIALAVGFILIYLVMVAIFQSFLMPLIIMICVPLGFTGGFLLLFICQMPLSLPALIGFLILMGVVINNGILAVDYTNQARRDGLSVKEALVAAMHTRMRPIFMTALTTILALVPMALGISFFNVGGSTALMQPLAVVAIGGLLFGTITTLIVVPAFYAIFCRDKKTTNPTPVAQ